jgi:hypothetical protein
LQRIDEKLERYLTESTELSVAEAYVEPLTSQEPSLLQDIRHNAAKDLRRKEFDAKAATRQVLDESQDQLSEVLDRLNQRLASLIQEGIPGKDKEKLQLYEDLISSKQSIELSKTVAKDLQQTIFGNRTPITGDENDQVIVASSGDLLRARKVVYQGRPAQLIGSMTDDGFKKLVVRR